MDYKEWKIKQLEKELSEKEGHPVRIFSIRKIDGIKHITIISEYAYEKMQNNKEIEK